MLPPLVTASFEVIEPKFVLEVLVLLLDGPALMREGHDLLEGGGRRQMHEEVLRDGLAAARTLAEQPHLGGQPAAAPWMGRGDAQGCKIRHPRRVVAVAPGDASPGARGQRGRDLGE